MLIRGGNETSWGIRCWNGSWWIVDDERRVSPARNNRHDLVSSDIHSKGLARLDTSTRMVFWWFAIQRKEPSRKQPISLFAPWLTEEMELENTQVRFVWILRGLRYLNSGSSWSLYHSRRIIHNQPSDYCYGWRSPPRKNRPLLD